MTTCHACGAEAAGRDRFCRNCGAPVAASVTDLEDTYRFDPPAQVVAQGGTREVTNQLYNPPPGLQQRADSGLLGQFGAIFRNLIHRKLVWLALLLLLALLAPLGYTIARDIVRTRRMARMEQARDIDLQRRARQTRQADIAQKSFEVAIQNALGFKPEPVSPAEYPDLQGVFVASLLSDYSPAALAHIQAGDVIREINGQAVPTMAEMDRVLSSIRPGTEVPANLYRDGQAVATRIRVADRTAAPILPMTDPRDEGFLGLGNVVRRCCAPGSRRWGLEVRRVIDNSPADLAGLRLGDLVTEFNGQATLTADEFSRRIRASEPRQKLKLKFYRGNTEHTVEFILGHGWVETGSLRQPERLQR